MSGTALDSLCSNSLLGGTRKTHGVFSEIVLNLWYNFTFYCPYAEQFRRVFLCRFSNHRIKLKRFFLATFTICIAKNESLKSCNHFEVAKRSIDFYCLMPFKWNPMRFQIKALHQCVTKHKYDLCYHNRNMKAENQKVCIFFGLTLLLRLNARKKNNVKL